MRQNLTRHCSSTRNRSKPQLGKDRYIKFSVFSFYFKKNRSINHVIVNPSSIEFVVHWTDKDTWELFYAVLSSHSFTLEIWVIFHSNILCEAVSSVICLSHFSMVLFYM
jgi:hypothetical protein